MERMLSMRTQVHKRCQQPERTHREVAEKLKAFGCCGKNADLGVEHKGLADGNSILDVELGDGTFNFVCFFRRPQNGMTFVERSMESRSRYLVKNPLPIVAPTEPSRLAIRL